MLLLLMKTLTRKQVDDLCYHINNKYETAHGNCGMFAYALASVLGFDNCELGMAQNTYYDDEAFYHVAVKYRGWYFDGRGHLLKQDLKTWADDEGLWGDGLRAYSYVCKYEFAWCDEERLKSSTDWMLPSQVFELEMLSFLGREIPQSLVDKIEKDRIKCEADGFHSQLNENQCCQLCGHENTRLRA